MEEYTREYIEGMAKTKIEDLFFNTYGNATLNRYADKKVFSTNISKETVEEFVRLFNEISGSDSDYIWFKIKNNLQERLQLYKDKTPVEEFLYALKLRSNCFGKEGKGLDYSKLEAYAKALNYLYQEGDKSVFFQVIKHTLVNWEWYQPLHVCIYLLGEHPELSDKEVDEILCEKMLYRKSYWMTTFDALIRRISQENYQALMDFLMKREVSDIMTGAVFEVATRRKRELFADAIYGIRQTPMYQELCVRYFTTYMGKQKYKRNIRTFMENIFPSSTNGIAGDYWIQKADAYSKMTDSEKTRALQEFRLNFAVYKQDDRNKIPNICEPDFLDVVIEKAEKASTNDQNWTCIMLAKNQTGYAYPYIRKRYNDRAKKGMKPIALMAACYIADGKPALKDIVDVFFCSTTLPDTASIPILKHAVTSRKSQKEFQNLVVDLIAQLNTTQEENSLLERLSMFYGNGQLNVSLYPIREMDAFLKEMLEKSLKCQDMSSVDKILTILSKVSDDSSKSRYESMLVSICNSVNGNTNQFRVAKEILSRNHE